MPNENFKITMTLGWEKFHEQAEPIVELLMTKGYSRDTAAMLFMLNRLCNYATKTNELLMHAINQGNKPPELPGDEWRNK